MGMAPPSGAERSVLDFTRVSGDAVVLSLWPSSAPGTAVEQAREYLLSHGCRVMYEKSVAIHDDDDSYKNTLSLLLVLAMYWGEEWLSSNCWYDEQPLEDLGIGLTRPTGHWPGAKWKRDLCFRGTRPSVMHVIVADCGRCITESLWGAKYGIRSLMARESGHAGNSCMHLTDRQPPIDDDGRCGGGGRGMDCNASFAFACARALLNPAAMAFMSECGGALCRGQDDNRHLGSEEFLESFGAFCAWLGDRRFADIVDDDSAPGACRWATPPWQISSTT